MRTRNKDLPQRNARRLAETTSHYRAPRNIVYNVRTRLRMRLRPGSLFHPLSTIRERRIRVANARPAHRDSILLEDIPWNPTERAAREVRGARFPLTCSKSIGKMHENTHTQCIPSPNILLAGETRIQMARRVHLPHKCLHRGSGLLPRECIEWRKDEHSPFSPRRSLSAGDADPFDRAHCKWVRTLF